ncbi:unnamed protein product [Ectocarpus sp. 12 AP-2014]
MYHRRATNRSRSSFSASRTAARSAYRRGDDDLTRAMGRMSVRATSNIRIPPLSAFSSGAVAVAGSAVRVGECIPPAEDIPTNFRTPTAYLKAMQAHTQKEFGASARQGVNNADRQGGGWLLLTCRPNPRWQNNRLSYYVHGKSENGGLGTRDTEEDGHNFKQDPWSRHLVEFDDSSIALVVACVEGVTDNEAFLAIAPGVDDIPVRSEHLQTRVRSLGYVGSFLREYGSAAELLRRDESDSLLNAVAAPGQCTLPSSSGAGTFLPRGQVRTLDTSSVPLNATQKDAVLSLTGGLDLVVGPPGTGKSTTIYHIIESRIRAEGRVLITSIRNQAVDAVTEKVDSFGVLVFGNEARLGPHSKNFTMSGRMTNDAELLFWRDARATWAKHLKAAQAVSWSRLHLPKFPGIARLLALEQESLRSTGTGNKHDKLRRSGRAAGKWASALKRVLKANFYKRLENGSRGQRLMLRQLNALDKWVRLLSQGTSRVASLLMRLEGLTRFRIFTETRVLICTVDSTERMVVSSTFYDGKLKTAEELRLTRISRQPCKWVHVSGGETKHQGRGYSNHLEIPKVVEEVRASMHRYGREADIRVITFYNMQKRDLEREFKDQPDIKNVRIASVDSCQGSDADVVVISTVRSGGVGYRLSGFMTDRRRVNVAISRAKEECIIVGDKHTLRSGGGAMWRSVADHFTS